MPARELPIDVLIFGGGIAGLWTLARLRREGYSCVLIERDALGSGQTIASQGIIHGGIKYALTGQASRASAAIAGMPALWEDCLAGRGEVDLRAAGVLSQRQYLWTSAGIGSRLAGVAASKAIRTPVRALAADERPGCFAGAPRGVDVYVVEEKVLEPRSLVRALAEPLSDALVRCEQVSVDMRGGSVRAQIQGPSGTRILSARAIVLTAGEGNAALLVALGIDPQAASEQVEQQIRPLHMVMARGPLPVIFGHCVAMSDKPRITITTQVGDGGEPVWYIGGDIAETGVERDEHSQIAAAKKEVASCVPWIDLSLARWATLRINRAEGVMGPKRNQRPDEPLIHSVIPGVLLAYPTKLAFAPLLAARVAESLRSAGIPPSGQLDASALADAQRPAAAALPWDRRDLSWS